MAHWGKSNIDLHVSPLFLEIALGENNAEWTSIVEPHLQITTGLLSIQETTNIAAAWQAREAPARLPTCFSIYNLQNPFLVCLHCYYHAFLQGQINIGTNRAPAPGPLLKIGLAVPDGNLGWLGWTQSGRGPSGSLIRHIRGLPAESS